MEKLKLKHLAGYLPYGIEGLDLLNRKVKVVGLKHASYFIDNENKEVYGTIPNLKIILRPLSDLKKPITIKEITFNPIEYNAFKHDIQSIIKFQNGFIHYKALKYGIIERLLEWHFDIYGLIEKGLAIDINTLK